MTMRSVVLHGIICYGYVTPFLVADSLEVNLRVTLGSTVCLLRLCNARI